MNENLWGFVDDDFLRDKYILLAHDNSNGPGLQPSKQYKWETNQRHDPLRSRKTSQYYTVDCKK